MINSPKAKELSIEAAQEHSAEREARAIVYNFISSLFAKEVTADLVTQLTSTQGQSFLNSLALEPSLSASVNAINAKLATLAKLNNEESLLELAADFCGLFLVDGRTSVSPYAGQYLGVMPSEESGSRKKKDRVELFGELHQQMTAFLTDNKLQIHSDFPEPGDHIAVILAYIAHLCTATEDEEQLKFINNYLMTWLGDFSEQVHKHDKGLFYQAVVGLTQEWLKVDLEYLMNS